MGQAVQYTFGSGTNQQWSVTKQTDGYYKLQPIYNIGLAPETKDGVVTNKTTAQVNVLGGPLAGYQEAAKLLFFLMMMGKGGKTKAKTSSILLILFTILFICKILLK